MLNLGASSINDAFGLPAAAGNNTASFTLQTTPPLNYTGPADAGPDQFAHNATLVTLDGSDSYDVTGDPIATYAWTQTGGPPVVLDGRRRTAPDVHDRGHRRHLHVRPHRDHGGGVELDRLGDGHQQRQRRARRERGTGPDREDRGHHGHAGGSASDANLDPLTYSWTQTGGPPVTLADPTTRRPSFVVPPVTAPAGDTFTFALTADDGFPGGTGTDSVTVTSAASTPTVTVAKTRCRWHVHELLHRGPADALRRHHEPRRHQPGRLHLRLVAGERSHDGAVVHDGRHPDVHAPVERCGPDDGRVHEWHDRDVTDLGELPTVPGRGDEDEHEQVLGGRPRSPRTPARCRRGRWPTPAPRSRSSPATR